MLKNFKNITLFVPLILLFILFACNEEIENGEYDIRFSPVSKVNIQDTTSIYRSIEITVEHTGLNSCAEYSHYKLIDNIPKYYYFELYAKYPKDAYCYQNLISISTTINISFSQKGKNYLYFKQYDDKYLLDSVFVK
ncbi:MAG: hypothetical protein V1779_05425 [bacterium]